jgi:hypothetical protein
MMPAERVTGTVPVVPYAAAEFSHLLDQLLAGHPGQVFVHRFLS